MSVRNGLGCALGLVLMVVCAAGCGTVQEWDYFQDVKGDGASTGQETDVPRLMQQMRVTNIRLMDSLIYMDAPAVVDNSVRMYEFARSLAQTQPALALQSPDDSAKYKRIADELADVIVEVGRAAQANRLDRADMVYAQAFPLCNHCHQQFRVKVEPKPLNLPEIETKTAPKTETAPSTPQTTSEVPKLEAAPQ